MHFTGLLQFYNYWCSVPFSIPKSRSLGISALRVSYPAQTGGSCCYFGLWYAYLMYIKYLVSMLNPSITVRIFMFQDHPANYGVEISPPALVL